MAGALSREVSNPLPCAKAGVDTADCSQGEVFEVTRIERDVDCFGLNCLKAELVGIDMTVLQLDELAERPVITIKILGQHNKMIVEIPQSYLRGFSAAVDEKSSADSPP